MIQLWRKLANTATIQEPLLLLTIFNTSVLRIWSKWVEKCGKVNCNFKAKTVKISKTYTCMKVNIMALNLKI